MRNGPLSAKYRIPLATLLVVAWLVGLAACSLPPTSDPPPTPCFLLRAGLALPAVTSLVVHDGVVYAGAVDLPASQSYIYALDARTGARLWRYPTVGLESTVVAVVDGVVYAGAGNSGKDSESVFALRASDGRLLWSVQTRQLWPPAVEVSDGVVYTADDDGMPGVIGVHPVLIALRASDGTLLWRRRAAADEHGSFSLPTVVGSVVYVYAGPLPQNGGYASIYALRASDGSVLWRLPWQRHLASIFAAPLVVDGVIYTSVDAGFAAYALRASDGAVLWRGRLDEGARGAPIVRDGLVYISTRDPVDALDASDGQLRWRFETPGAPLVAVPADGLLYVSDAAGTAALEAATGAVRWHRPLGWVGAAPGSAGGVLYLNDGSTTLEAVDAPTGHLLWRTNAELIATVSQADRGGVYVGAGAYVEGPCRPPSGAGYVYRFDATTGAVLWRYQTGGRLG